MNFRIIAFVHLQPQDLGMEMNVKMELMVPTVALLLTGVEQAKEIVTEMLTALKI